MTGTRLIAKHTKEELARFDKLTLAERQYIRIDLGKKNFDLLYGADRDPGIPNELPLDIQPPPQPSQPVQPKPGIKYPDGNPKTQFGLAKPDQWAIDPIAVYEMGLVMMQGMLKYGLFNYYEDPISISTYVNAARRHLDLYELGQDFDSDTNALHAAHMMACGSILVSAHYRGRLIDDRTPFKEMADGLEQYFKDNQDRVKKIREQWTGFAERMKAKKSDEHSGFQKRLIERPDEAVGMNGWDKSNQSITGTVKEVQGNLWIVECRDGVERRYFFTDFIIDNGH